MRLGQEFFFPLFGLFKCDTRNILIPYYYRTVSITNLYLPLATKRNPLHIIEILNT